MDAWGGRSWHICSVELNVTVLTSKSALHQFCICNSLAALAPRILLRKHAAELYRGGHTAQCKRDGHEPAALLNAQPNLSPEAATTYVHGARKISDGSASEGGAIRR